MRRRGSGTGYRLAFPSALASPASNPTMVVWRGLAEEEEEVKEEDEEEGGWRRRRRRRMMNRGTGEHG